MRHDRAASALADGVVETIAEAVQLQRQMERRLSATVVSSEDDADHFDRDDGNDDEEEYITPLAAGDVFDLPDPHTGLSDNAGGGGRFGRRCNLAENDILNDTLQYEPDGEYESLVQKWVADYLVNAQDYIESTDLTRRVNKWRTKITPVLALEEERQSFDIHSYGSKILDSFSNCGDVVPFSIVVSDTSRKEVARTFLSSLMLVSSATSIPGHPLMFR